MNDKALRRAIESAKKRILATISAETLKKIEDNAKKKNKDADQGDSQKQLRDPVG